MQKSSRVAFINKRGQAGGGSKVFTIAMPDATPSLRGYLLRAVRELALALSVCFCCRLSALEHCVSAACALLYYLFRRI